MAVGIITALNPLAQFQKAQDAKRKGDLSQIQKALETYYQDIGQYPASTPDYKIKKLDSPDGVEWGTSWAPYMSVLPKDPNQDKTYMYFSGNVPPIQAYYLFAKLDRGSKDPQVCQRMPGVFECQFAKLAELKCGGTAICDYGVSSPNTSP